MFMHRLRVLWLGFWSSLVGRGERHHDMVSHGTIAVQKQQLSRIRDALTNLIFQRKKMEDRLEIVTHELGEVKLDLQRAAASDRDELAVRLIARVEALQGEQSFLTNQVETLKREIASARDTERQLQRDLDQGMQLIGALSSRFEALKVQKQLRNDLQSINHSMAKGTLQNSAMADQIKRMEAELEATVRQEEDWEKGWRELRGEREQERHREILDRLKQNLRAQKVPIVLANTSL